MPHPHLKQYFNPCCGCLYPAPDLGIHAPDHCIPAAPDPDHCIHEAPNPDHCIHEAPDPDHCILEALDQDLEIQLRNRIVLVNIVPNMFTRTWKNTL